MATIYHAPGRPVFCPLRFPASFVPVLDPSITKRFGFKPLTARVKEKILGLNSARVYGVDVKAKMNAIPSDYVTRLKQKYRAEGAQPSNTQYGWIRG